MVPENSQHSTSSTHLRQQIRTRLDESGSSFASSHIFLEHWYRHEIAGQRDEVGFQSIDNVDRFANRHYRKMFVVMEIAHLRDPDSIPGFGQARERNFNPHQLRIIRLNNRAVNSQAQSARHPYHRARAEKLPSGCANAQMSYLVHVVHSEKIGRWRKTRCQEWTSDLATVRTGKQKVRAAPSISILRKFCPKNRRSGT